MNDEWATLLDILAKAALFLAPVLTYLIASRKENRESILSDIEAVKGWAEERRAFEKDLRDARALITDLYTEVDKQRQLRRASDARSEELEARLAKVEKALADCTQLTND